jgi:hypothetical protein
MRTLALILFIINLIATLVLYGFFLVGIGDGTVSAYNIGLWLPILVGFSAVVAGGWILRAKGRAGIATAILLPAAIPCTLYGVFVLLLIILQPRWN